MSALGCAIDANGGLSSEISIDLDALIGSHACAIANSGGGKSGLVRRLLETTHGAIQQIVLDPEDEFYTLRERFDYVIAGGEGGDIPATVEGAAGLALGALTHGFSLIVQLNDLDEIDPLDPNRNPRAEFVANFLSALIRAPRDLWHPCLVVVDEVQLFAPSEGKTPASAAVKQLTSRGRKRGFTAVLASQRISKISADVRGDINNWLLGRTGQTLDRNIMADQLGFTPAEGRAKLRVEARSFWGFGPAIAAEPILFRVADVETTLVKSGQAKVLTPPAPEALRDILAGLAAVAQVEVLPADPKNPDPAPLAKLREELRARDRQIDLLTANRDWHQRRGDHHANALAAIRSSTSAALSAFDERAEPEMPSQGCEAPTPITTPKSEAPATVTPKRSVVAPTAGASGTPSPAALAIADLLDRVNPARLTWAQAAMMTKRKASGGNFNTARRWLRDSGRIVEDGEFIRSSSEAPAGMSRSEAIDLWRSVLTNPAPRMIDALLEHPTRHWSKEDLGVALDCAPRGGNFNNGLAQLRRNGLLSDVGGLFRLATPLPGERA